MESREELEKILSLLKATLDATTDGILVVNQTGRMVSFNQQFGQMWKIPQSVLETRDDNEALAYVLDQLRSPDAFLKKVRDLYNQPEAESFDTLEFKDGRVFERYSRPQRIGGQSVGRVWSFRDVTERKRLEAAQQQRAENVIRRQNALLQLAKLEYDHFSSAVQKITEIDAEILGVQRVSVWFFRQGRTEIRCDDLFKKEEGVHEAGAVLESKNYPRYFMVLEENRLVAADDAMTDPATSEFAEGYLKPLGITSMMDAPIRILGQVIGVLCHEHVGPSRKWSLEDREFAGSVADFVALALETSEHRRAEKALEKRTRELLRSNKELEQFAYIASHDLQEPLYTINGFVERLEEVCKSKMDPVGHDYLVRIRRSAQRMITLVSDLLAYSRVSTQRRPFEEVFLDEIMQKVLADLEHQIDQSGGKVEVSTLAKISGDRFQIRQLFQNLLSNGLKFCKKSQKPHVVITGRDIEGDSYEVSIRDDGIGFDPKYSEQIFHPFQRLNSWGEYPGSGIGLAICRKIVERHGGKISATSQPEKGTTVTVTLPKVAS